MINDIQFSQVSNFEYDVQEARIWYITIVIYETLKCSITVISEFNTSK